MLVVLLVGCQPVIRPVAVDKARSPVPPSPSSPMPPPLPTVALSASEPPPRPPPASLPSPPSRQPVTRREPVTQFALPVRIERRVSDGSTRGFARSVMRVLSDRRGWVRAGFHFRRDPDAAARIVLAEGDEVDALCRPYDTEGLYSCQNGPVVALNADRWRTATPSWPGSLEDYRRMLVNHEVGHLLHLHHPRPQCPGAGLPAPVMAQQSTGLNGCTANPWPLQWEVDLAASRREPLAPPATHDTSDHRPSPPPEGRP